MRSRFAVPSLVLSLTITTLALAQNRSLPSDAFTIDVRSFGAVGNGVTDDTAAIQAAIIGDRTPFGPDDSPDRYDPFPRVVFFPAGTYLVSDTITWLGNAVALQGTGRTTIIKLQNAAAGFADPMDRKPVLQTMDGNYSFKEHIFDLVVDTGIGNPGAVGIDWICNNVGAIRNVLVRSGDGAGVAGIDLTRQWPGPALIRDTIVEGFDYGLDVGHAEYGLTFENVTLRNQRVSGIHNHENVLCVRRLTTEGVPLAVDNESSGGMILLLDSTLGGTGAVAVRNQGHMYLRHVTSSGFDNLLDERGTVQPGTSVTDERLTGAIQQLFPSPQRSLNLPIHELPSYPDDPPEQWQLADCGYQGCEGVLQSALDAGKRTVYFQSGVKLIGGGTFRVPASVRRIVGFGTHVNSYDDYGLTFEVAEDSPEPLIIEHFANALHVLHASPRTVVVKSAQLSYQAEPGAGDLFLDDIGTDLVKTVPGQNVWAWQLNIEGDQLHIDNEGANVWVFGLKSERRGTIARTTARGYTEFLGHLLYGTMSWEADSPQSAFINVESGHSIVFAMSSYVTDGFYPNLVEETRDGVTRTLPSSALDGRFMPLFVGYRDAPPSGTGGDGGAGGGPSSTCTAGLTPCGAACVDTATDVSHCGGCNLACPIGQACEDGGCVCTGGLTLCGSDCVDLQSDGAHCGACDSACDPGLVCDQGHCSAACSAGLSQCGQDCADLATSLSHCGACGSVCALAGAVAVCTDGVCVIAECTPAHVDLDGVAANGCECASQGVETCNGVDDDCDGAVDEEIDCATAADQDSGCGCRTTRTPASGVGTALLWLAAALIRRRRSPGRTVTKRATRRARRPRPRRLAQPAARRP